MDPIRFSIQRPVTVIVGIILVVIFGLIGLSRMPYQLSPTVVEPVITVTTTWRGATPYEIEREIIEEQEDTLKGIPGLVEMESDAFNGQGSITLRFVLGTDLDDALLRVSNKLNEVESYPEGTDRPIINATGAATSPVIWCVMRASPGNTRPVDTYKTFFENEIRQYLERIEGVADLFVGGGRLEELHVVVDPVRLAAYGLTIRDLSAAIFSGNQNVSAGTMGVGRRDFRIRTTAEFKTPAEVERLVLRSTGQQRVVLADVADVRRGFSKETTAMLHNGENGMVVGIKPEPGVNILDMSDRAYEVVQWLNREKLKPQGVYLDWVYDQRSYIRGAIDLIRKNILVGGSLAVVVLLVFLRSIASTAVVATAIPISIIGTFMFMYIFGRNLNVVSLAGIAFAIGMLVDNAIVVMENIDRHRTMGKRPFDAAYDGTREVWGAVLASTATTVAVFLPVVFLEEEAGQLFRDIALAVVAAVILSLLVSITVMPMFSRYLFGLTAGSRRRKKSGLVRAASRVVDAIVAAVGFAIANWRRRLLTIGLLTGAAVLVSMILLPKMEYLPQGNRNLVLNIFVPPPGLSVEERQQIGENLFAAVAPYLGKEETNGIPGIQNMFYVAAEQIMICGAISTQPERARELLPLFNRLLNSIPGMYGVSIQPGIFQTRLGRGRTIDLNIRGENLAGIVRAAGMLFGQIRGAMPGTQVRPIPSMELQYPEVRIVPDRDRLKAVGMNEADLGEAVDVIMDGRIVSEFKEEGKKKVDLVLMSSDEQIRTPEDVYRALLATPKSEVVPVSSLAELHRTSGITQIRHLERLRTITLQITPPEDLPLQAAMETIEEKILGPSRQAGTLGGVDIEMSGAADKLLETKSALQWNFVLAAAIAYLLMSALFGNFIYPLAIMFTVPLAGAGGFLGLQVLNLFVNQPMDIVTMLGFVILVGVVVNNAILIVYQSLTNVREHGMDYLPAVLESVRVRLRPIYMSTTTSIFGMLPLVLFPGSGSELYRGLGSVILGGLALSTVFTIFVIPALLMFVIRMEKIQDLGE
ncbi:MAG: efflux RND transporter permease subunit [Desulfobacterales bacterium]